MKIAQLGIDVKDFTEADIVNMDIVRKNAATESQKIFNNESTRKGRTLDEIYRVSLQSHIAERRLIEEHGFKNDPRPYMDVIYKGATIDVKTSTNSILATKSDIIKELEERKTWADNVADNVIGLDIDKDGVYKCRCYDSVADPSSKTNTIKLKRPKFTIVNKSLTKKIYTTPEVLYNGLLRNGKSINQASSIMRDYGIKVVV